MNFTVFETEGEVASWAADRIEALFACRPEALLCIAAGHSSLGVFDELVRRKVDFSRGWFAAMDEWRGMNEHTPGSCGDFLRKHFLSRVKFQEEHIRLVDGAADDLDAECKAVEDFVEARGGFDLILLGMGMNGHLALNEPGVDPALSVHVTRLDEVTMRVGQKYFDAPSTLQGGVTIGLADIRKAKEILLCVQGAHKREILNKMMTGPVSNALPASLLRELPHAATACDRSAAGALTAVL